MMYSVFSVEDQLLFIGSLKECLSFFKENLSIVRKPLKKEVIKWWKEEYANDSFPHWDIW